MNYQPFLEMNLLVSDELVFELHRLLPSLILFLVATFYLLFFLHITFYKLYMTLRAPKRNYPAHIKQGGN